MNTTIHRVIPRSGKTYISKIYNAESKLRNDLRVSRLLGRLPDDPLRHFQVARISRGKLKLEAIVDDVRGRSLEWILAQKTIPEAIREELTRQYQLKLDNLYHAFQKQPEFKGITAEINDDIEHLSLQFNEKTGSQTMIGSFFDRSENQSFHLFIHPGQIIVPPFRRLKDVQMYIVDPY